MKKIFFTLLTLLIFAELSEAATNKCKAKGGQTAKYDTTTKRCVYKKCPVRKLQKVTVVANKCIYQVKTVPTPTPTITPTPTPNPMGNWVIKSVVDPLDGKSSYAANLVGDAGRTLSIMCLKDQHIYFAYRGEFVSYFDIDVEYRADSTVYDTEEWTPMPDGKGAIYPDLFHTVTALNRIINSSEIYMRLTGSINSDEDRFATQGMDVAFTEIASHCFDAKYQVCPFEQTSYECLLNMASH